MGVYREYNHNECMISRTFTHHYHLLWRCAGTTHCSALNNQTYYIIFPHSNQTCCIIFPHSNLVKVLKWVTEANPSERQVCNIAKSMFRKMVAEGKKSISKSEIDQRARVLLQPTAGEPSSSTTVESQSFKDLEPSVKRMLHGALQLSDTGEVG